VSLFCNLLIVGGLFVKRDKFFCWEGYEFAGTGVGGRATEIGCGLLHRFLKIRVPQSEKLRILAAADACVAPGEIGALLRQEGIYSSHLATWRK
jgi:hypothetical protein